MKKFTIVTKQQGSIAVEYMVLTVFIGLTLIAGASALGGSLNSGLSNIGSSINTLFGAQPSGGNENTSGGDNTDSGDDEVINLHNYTSEQDNDVAYYKDVSNDKEYKVYVDTDTGYKYYTYEDGEKYYLNSDYIVTKGDDDVTYVYSKDEHEITIEPHEGDGYIP